MKSTPLAAASSFILALALAAPALAADRQAQNREAGKPQRDIEKSSYAMVSVGGFLGIGEKEVTIPLRDLRMKGKHLVAPLTITEKGLEARPAYEKGMYEDVPDEEMVSLGAPRSPISISTATAT